MDTLKVHVERIVRPIRAYGPRKNQFREELLSHLETAYREELACEGSAEVAVQRTVARLGDIDTLRAELQASVSPIERAFFMPVSQFRYIEDLSNGPRPGEGRTAYAARYAASITLLVVPLTVLTAVVCLAVKMTGSPQADLVRLPWQALFVVCSLGCLAASLFVTAFVFELAGLRARMVKSHATPAIWKACLLLLYAASAVGGFLLLVIPLAGLASPRFVTVPPAAALAAAVSTVPAYAPIAGMLAFIGFAALAFRYEKRQHDRWGRLNIDE